MFVCMATNELRIKRNGHFQATSNDEIGKNIFGGNENCLLQKRCLPIALGHFKRISSEKISILIRTTIVIFVNILAELRYWQILNIHTVPNLG